MDTADEGGVVQILSAVHLYVKNSLSRICLSLLLSVLFVAELQAVTWEIERGFSFELGGAEEKNETLQSVDRSSATRLIPYVDLSGRGKNTDLRFRASLNLSHDLDDSTNDSDSIFQFVSNTRLVDRVFSVSSAASVAERISEADTIVDSTVPLIGNRTRTSELSVTPLLEIPFGNDALLEASLRFAAVQGTAENEEIGGKSTEFISEVSQSTRQGLIGSIRIGVLNNNFDNGEVLENNSISGGLSQPLGRTLSIYASGGYETLRIQSVDISEKGESWRLGFTWNPLERVAVDISYGRRLFGRNPRMSIMLQGRRSLLQFSLTRDLAFDRSSLDPFMDVELQQEGAGALGAEDSELDLGSTVGTLSPTSSDARAIEERASISYTLFGNRSELTGVVSWRERSEIDDEDTIETIAVELAFQRRLSSRTNVLVTLSEQIRDSNFIGETEESRIRIASVVFNYAL